MNKLKYLTLIIALIAVSCQSKIKQEKNSPITEFKIKPIQEISLENGFKIYLIKDDSLPRISLQMLTKVGTISEKNNEIGLNSLVASLLDQGTKKRNAIQIAESLGDIGTEFSVSPSSDYTLMSMDMLSPSWKEGIDLFSEIILNPSFDPKEINRQKSQILDLLKKRTEDPNQVGNEKFETLMMHNHPYGRTAEEYISFISKFEKKEIINFYNRNYLPNNSTLAIVGQFDENVVSHLKKVFENWKKSDVEIDKLQKVSKVTQQEVKLVSKKGLAQTQIRIGQMGVSRKNENYLTLRLANEVLGGGFVSRLMQEVRDRQGLTYSISSGFGFKKYESPFEISTFTKNETVGKTLEVTLKVFNDFSVNGITEKELQDAKAQLKGQFPRAIETADRLAMNYMLLKYHEISPDYLNTFYKEVDRISLENVNKVIKEQFASQKVKILIYGDKSKIQDQLIKYNPEIEDLN